VGEGKAFFGNVAGDVKVVEGESGKDEVTDFGESCCGWVEEDTWLRGLEN
jgi:hypothetical protein